ncbi:sulfotransferase domain-containing protein [Flavivirga spongiicola]|uniref:Sulfotransferase n=1 Tax=Flavivirga spongiicola TaxID=421621 RepID=A0ABU7XWF3_9FLAO|nr:sulfotransferase domain-containing protein [Flavivirga sp. MEBiC05379]MDO5980111.1 sulfotransferase domain-containing protein [Flavivirga sp. MEBiC05379]
MNHFCPNLFIPGAAKSGTSTLHSLLDLHPDICMSKQKEPVYWDSPEFNNFNLKKKKWYSNQFYNKKAIFFGESTTSYMFFPNYIINLKAHYKAPPKFIFILRNPIDRCYSHYWWIVGLGLEKRKLAQAIDQDLSRTLKPYNYFPDYYYHFSLYGKWLIPFFENFDKKNIKIITLENLKHRRLETLNECFMFLGLKELDEIPKIILNKTSKLKYPRLYHFNLKILKGKFTNIIKFFIPNQIKDKLKSLEFLKNKKPFNYPKISKEERLTLQLLFQEDVKALKKLTGLNFEEWTDFKN